MSAPTPNPTDSPAVVNPAMNTGIDDSPSTDPLLPTSHSLQPSPPVNHPTLSLYQGPRSGSLQIPPFFDESSTAFVTSINFRRGDHSEHRHSPLLYHGTRSGNFQSGSVSVLGYTSNGTDETDHHHSFPLLTPSDVMTMTTTSTLSKLSVTGDGSDFDTCISTLGGVQARPTLSQGTNSDPTPFAFSPYDLASIFHSKNLDTSMALGGTAPLKGLGTHTAAMTTGRVETFKPSGSEPLQRYDCHSRSSAFHAALDERRRIHERNAPPRRHSSTLMKLIWSAFKDKVVVLLSLVAVVSLVLGLFQDISTAQVEHWVEGVAILVFMLVVVIVGSLNDWQSERQFTALNDKREKRGVKVIRGGVKQVIDVKHVVRDVGLLEPVDIVPCDGVVLSAHNLKCNESGATGDSDAIKKASYDECLVKKDRTAGGASALEVGHGQTDRFIVSGSRVLDGVGSYFVVAVGQRNFNRKTMMALLGNAEFTPLQVKLIHLTEISTKIGKAAGAFVFMVLMIMFCLKLGKGAHKPTPVEICTALVNIVIISLTLVVLAALNGFPRTISLALAFITKRMVRDKLLVRQLSSCETLADVSTIICTDKTLTQSDMMVVAGSIGVHGKFVRNLAHNEAQSDPDENHSPIQSTNRTQARKHLEDFLIDQAQLNSILSPQLRDLIYDAIRVSPTSSETGETLVTGSKLQAALDKFAEDFSLSEYRDNNRKATDIVQSIPFSGERTMRGAVVKLAGVYRLYLKGASQTLAGRCTRHVVVSTPGTDQRMETATIDESERDNIQRTIMFYDGQTLHTVALCYRDFKSWPPPAVCVYPKDQVPYEDLCNDLVLISIIAIEDPLTHGVRTTVEKCRQAGVSVKMCTSDNITTARSIALQCGIYSPGGIAMEGPVFRSLDERQKLEVVPSLQVLAQSSPEDERIVVEKLKELGEIVAVTGHDANDVPVLETADVGFSMGISGTDVTKEASDITLMDDNFASVIKALMWGRCVNDCVRKFLQFCISTQVTAIAIALVSAFTSSENSPVLSSVQLLWINIIMDPFAALAFATDPAFETLLDRKPNKKAKLFNVDTYKQIFSQSIYQIIFTLTLHFTGQQILGFPAGPFDQTIQEHNKAIVQTVVFNSLVFALIFNSINCRRLDKKLNIFEGITRNYYFLAIISIEIAVQVLIVFFGGTGFGVMPINRREWVISLLLGVASIPIGALARLLPNYPFEILFTSMRLLPTPEVLPVVRSGWRTSIDRVQENRTTSSPFRCGSNISSPAPAYLRDRSVQHACASLTVIPVDARPFMMWRPVRPMRKSRRMRAGVVLAGLSMALTFVGLVFTGIQISATSPKS